MEKEYGKRLLEKEFENRIQAFFIEQAILFDSINQADCPEELLDWSGHTEIRELTSNEAEELFFSMKRK